MGNYVKVLALHIKFLKIFERKYYEDTQRGHILFYSGVKPSSYKRVSVIPGVTVANRFGSSIVFQKMDQQLQLVLQEWMEDTEMCMYTK